jgi:intron-binding protein aquarius
VRLLLFFFFFFAAERPDLFVKITERDIDPRHLIRLGRGERELRERTDADFSINGRVAYTLERRQLLLNNVRRIAETLGVPGASEVAYTCETAEHFQLFHVVSRVEAFELAVAAQAAQAPSPPPGTVASLFPFAAYVAASGATPGPFAGLSFEDDLAAARRSFRQIESMFEELADFRAFELLRTSRQREDYLLTKQARVVALTCTHAALARRRLIRLNFKVCPRASLLPLRCSSPASLRRPAPTRRAHTRSPALSHPACPPRAV